MPYSKAELKVRRLERALREAEATLEETHLTFSMARNKRDKIKGRLYFANMELDDEREGKEV